MTHLPSLPEDLKNRLLAAGVTDDTTLHAVLDADPDLRAAYEDWLYDSVVYAFASTKDREALLELSEQVPLLASDEFVEFVQRAIGKALDMGEYDDAEALRQRLDALKDIRAMKAYQRQAPLARAVIAFVQAVDEVDARQTFENQRDLLDTDAAEKMLAQEFEANDDKARTHLQRRAALLRKFRSQ